jgi:hypothetical protein
MTIKSRIWKLEALSVKCHAFGGSMAEIDTEQAEKTYNEVMNGPSSPFIARTQKGKVFIDELSEQKLGQIYKKYADGNFDIITEQEV